MKLQNKRALVTGGDSGIGQAIAEVFAKEGTDVVVVYHTDEAGAGETRPSPREWRGRAHRQHLVRRAASADARKRGLWHGEGRLGSFARSLSRELAEDRINVNNIAPGLIQTPMTQDRLDDPKAREESFEKILWHRAGQPEEIGRLALFLASDDGDYVTGQTWVMDGGLTMQWGGA